MRPMTDISACHGLAASVHAGRHRWRWCARCLNGRALQFDGAPAPREDGYLGVLQARPLLQLQVSAVHLCGALREGDEELAVSNLQAQLLPRPQVLDLHFQVVVRIVA